jgi:hypothetical protein
MHFITTHFTKYFSEMEKMEGFFIFKTLLNFKNGQKKCPIFILKKKFQKTKILFFWHFFWHSNVKFLMLNGNATFYENGIETISFFSKKTHFFRFFRLFFRNSKKFPGPFCPQKNEHHRFFHVFFREQYIFNNKYFIS